MSVLTSIPAARVPRSTSQCNHVWRTLACRLHGSRLQVEHVSVDERAIVTVARPDQLYIMHVNDRQHNAMHDHEAEWPTAFLPCGACMYFVHAAAGIQADESMMAIVLAPQQVKQVEADVDSSVRMK